MNSKDILIESIGDAAGKYADEVARLKAEEKKRTSRFAYTAAALLLTVGAAIPLLILLPKQSGEDKSAAAPTDQPGIIVSSVSSGGHADACYSVTAFSFSEMEQQADVIVLAEPVSQYSKAEGLTMTAVLDVKKLFKGECETTIELYQMDDGYKVSIGRQYLLFLGKQESGEPGRAAYYNVAGPEAKYEYDPERERLVASSATMLGCDLDKWLAVNMPELGEKPAALELARLEKYHSSPACLETIYDSFERLKNDAYCIVHVKVLGQNIELVNDLPQTHTSIRILETLKGGETAGSVLDVVEEGGFSDELLFGNYPQLAKGTEYLLFLSYSDGNYYICGAFQGRFILRGGYVIQQKTDEVGLNDYVPVTLEEFKELVG